MKSLRSDIHLFSQNFFERARQFPVIINETPPTHSLSIVLFNPPGPPQGTRSRLPRRAEAEYLSPWSHRGSMSERLCRPGQGPEKGRHFSCPRVLMAPGFPISSCLKVFTEGPRTDRSPRVRGRGVGQRGQQSHGLVL